MNDALRKACERALHVVTSDGRTLRAGRASLFMLERTTPGWRAFARTFRHAPLSWGVELGYWIVARNRGRMGRVLVRSREP